MCDENSNDSKIEYKGNKIIIKVNVNEDSKIYIPSNYENGSFSAKVNGEDASVERFATTYLSVDVKKGENVIELTFTPKMMKEGIILTLITLVLVIALFFINKKYEFFKKKKFKQVMYILGSVFGLLIGAYIYIIPLTK